MKEVRIADQNSTIKWSVIFLPLNQLRVDNCICCPYTSPYVTPIIKRCIQYDPKVNRAMYHVFGRKLLVRSTDAASTWSNQSFMYAIMLDGDLCIVERVN